MRWIYCCRLPDVTGEIVEFGLVQGKGNCFASLDRFTVGLTTQPELVQGEHPGVGDHHHRWIPIIADDSLREIR
jgi:hypothetical protein